jgi:hypothetical protein
MWADLDPIDVHLVCRGQRSTMAGQNSRERRDGREKLSFHAGMISPSPG